MALPNVYILAMSVLCVYYKIDILLICTLILFFLVLSTMFYVYDIMLCDVLYDYSHVPLIIQEIKEKEKSNQGK